MDDLEQLTAAVDRTIQSLRMVLQNGGGDAAAAARQDAEQKMGILFSFKKQHQNGEYQ